MRPIPNVSWVPALRERMGLFAFKGFSARAGLHRTPRRSALRRLKATRQGAAEMEQERMARIAGVNIPPNKRVVIALQYIHGIGPTKAEEICEKVHIPSERRVAQLTDSEG